VLPDQPFYRDKVDINTLTARHCFESSGKGPSIKNIRSQGRGVCVCVGGGLSSANKGGEEFFRYTLFGTKNFGFF